MIKKSNVIKYLKRLYLKCLVLNQRWNQNRLIKKWYCTLNLDQHYLIYQQLYEHTNGFALSKQARERNDALEYTYGEINFISFIALLSLAKPSKNTLFYDLGSGTGKAVLACAMVFKVQKSCGIELFAELHQAALEQKTRLNALPDYQSQANSIHFIHSNFLDINFNDATLIMINATAFFGETWLALNLKLEQLPTSVIVITTSKKLSSPAFSLIKTTVVEMSWGYVKAYIYHRN